MLQTEIIFFFLQAGRTWILRQLEFTVGSQHIYIPLPELNQNQKLKLDIISTLF